MTVTKTDSTIGGTPKYRKLITTPGTCSKQKIQPIAPTALGTDRASCPKCQARNACNNMETVADKPNPR